MTDSPMLSWLMARQMFMKPGLERIQALLERLGHPEQTYRCILVGGTNGKGSTTLALAGILQAAGYRVGRYISPHLVYFNERMAVNGQAIEDAALEALLTRIQPIASASGASFFEIATAAALLYFAEQGVAWAVLEVGLGGRFDATNATQPELSIITSIGLDHTEILGTTLPQIAYEKAGILRPHKLAFTAATGPGLQTLKQQASLLETPLRVLGEDFRLTQITPQPEGLRFGFASAEGQQLVYTPMLGLHQTQNLALAIAAARSLNIPWEAIAQGIAQVRHPGRLELITQTAFGDLVLDGAHNPQGAVALHHALQTHFVGRPLVLLLALSQDKDPQAIADTLEVQTYQKIVLTRYRSPRSKPPTQLLPHFPGAVLAEQPLEGLREACSGLAPDGLVVVAGSLYLVGEVKRLLLGLSPEERWQ